MVEVVAWAFSGQPVNLDSKVQGFSWTRLRDGGLCLIDDSGRVSVPYVLVTRVALLKPGHPLFHQSIGMFA